MEVLKTGTQDAIKVYPEDMDVVLTKMDESVAILEALSLCGDAASCISNETVSRIADVLLKKISSARDVLEACYSGGRPGKNGLTFESVYERLRNDPPLLELMKAAEGLPTGVILEAVATLEESKRIPEKAAES